METKITHSCTELTFLITCCKAVLSEDDKHYIATTIKSELLNKKALIELSYRHAVLPLLYTTLKNILPEEKLISTLKPYYMNTIQKNMSMSLELIEVLHLFKKFEIDALCFKGPVLSQVAYGDITLRQYGDLDILIKKEDKQKMIDLMIRNKYSPEITLKEQTKHTFLNAVNVLGFSTPSAKSFIEIHWRLLSKNYAIHWEESLLWNKTTSIQINHQTIQTLHFEQSLLYLCAHGSKHLFERLSWVCDIDRSVRNEKNIDWETLLNNAEKLGIRRILLLSLSLAQKLLNLPLPKEIEKKIATDTTIESLLTSIIRLHFSHYAKREKSYSTFKLLYLMRENTNDKFHFIWSALFATKFDDFKFIQLPTYLAFLYPLVRPLRLIIKYLK